MPFAFHFCDIFLPLLPPFVSSFQIHISFFSAALFVSGSLRLWWCPRISHRPPILCRSLNLFFRPSRPDSFFPGSSPLGRPFLRTNLHLCIDPPETLRAAILFSNSSSLLPHLSPAPSPHSLFSNPSPSLFCPRPRFISLSLSTRHERKISGTKRVRDSKKGCADRYISLGCLDHIDWYSSIWVLLFPHSFLLLSHAPTVSVSQIHNLSRTRHHIY